MRMMDIVLSLGMVIFVRMMNKGILSAISEIVLPMEACIVGEASFNYLGEGLRWRTWSSFGQWIRTPIGEVK